MSNEIKFNKAITYEDLFSPTRYDLTINYRHSDDIVIENLGYSQLKDLINGRCHVEYSIWDDHPIEDFCDDDGYIDDEHSEELNKLMSLTDDKRLKMDFIRELEDDDEPDGETYLSDLDFPDFTITDKLLNRNNITYSNRGVFTFNNVGVPYHIIEPLLNLQDKEWVADNIYVSEYDNKIICFNINDSNYTEICKFEELQELIKFVQTEISDKFILTGNIIIVEEYQNMSKKND